MYQTFTKECFTASTIFCANSVTSLKPEKVKSYSIPIIDISEETERHVVIAKGTEEIYQGHPHTLLMPDNKTMFCVWTYNHGGPCGPMKRSDDGGLTWSELLDVPDNWSDIRNCPTIHRLVNPDGKARLLVFAGNGDMYQSVSEDEGKTWTPMEKNGLKCVVAPMTVMPVDEGKKYLMWVHVRTEPVSVWQAATTDGGLTWKDFHKIVEVPDAVPCEPAVIRSPDGKQLLILMRENNRWLNSLYAVSDDQGKTWSDAKELPASLTGDRHACRYTPDGRLVICFRDMAEESPTKGHFVAWVGRYEDIVEGSEGQYRVKLLHHYGRKGDCGYPGLEILPDETLVATTYVDYEPGPEKNSVVGVSFKLSEIDEKAAKLPQETDVFVSGQQGYHTYRIPAVLVSNEDTLLAFCEGRKNSGSDHGDIDLMLKRSKDNGKTWSDQQIVYEEGGTAEITIGNPCPVVDKDTGTIWMPFCRDNNDVFVTSSNDDGVTWSKPRNITNAVRNPDWGWYATGPGVGIQLRHEPYKGRLVIPCDHREKIDGQWVMFSHVFYSDDHGETWKLGGSVEKHTDECQVVELSDGRLLINMRNYWGRSGNQPEKGGMRAIAWSKDGGETWSEIQFDETLIEPVCQASFIRYTDEHHNDKNRLLFSNPASKNSRDNGTIRLSYDEGKTWAISKTLYHGGFAYSCLTVLPDMSIGCLYEKDGYKKIIFARFSLDWLTD